MNTITPTRTITSALQPEKNWSPDRKGLDAIHEEALAHYAVSRLDNRPLEHGWETLAPTSDAVAQLMPA